MRDLFVSIGILENNLQDINNPRDIPKKVMDFFWEQKLNLGSRPMGIAYVGKKWYIFSPSLDKYILAIFDKYKILFKLEGEYHA